MKTKYIFISLALFLALIISLVLWNAFRVKRNFTLLKSVRFDFCILVDDRYSFSSDSRSLKYKGGSNHGHIELIKSGLSKDIIKSQIGDFEAGYKKIKNFRIYEYKLSDTYILRDTFENVKKMPLNLVPRRIDCPKIEEKFKVIKNIFTQKETL